VAVTFAADSASYVNSAMAAYLLNQDHWYLPGTVQYFDSAVFSNFVEFAGLVQFDEPVTFSNSVNVLDSLSVGTNLLVGSNLVVNGTLTVNDQVEGNLLVGGSLYASQLVDGVSGVVAGFEDYGYPTPSYQTNNAGQFTGTASDMTGAYVGLVRQRSFETNVAYSLVTPLTGSPILDTGFTNKFDSAVEAKRVTGLWGVRGAMDNVSPVEMYPGWRVVAIGELIKTNQFSVSLPVVSAATFESSLTNGSPYMYTIPGPWTNYYGSSWATVSPTGTVSLLQPGLYKLSGSLRATNVVVGAQIPDMAGHGFAPNAVLRLCGSTGLVARVFTMASGVGEFGESSGGPLGVPVDGEGACILQISAPCVVPFILRPGLTIESGYYPSSVAGVLTACRVIVEYQPFWRNDGAGTPTTNGPPGTTVTSPIPLF
jgi:hypothetical protein